MEQLYPCPDGFRRRGYGGRDLIQRIKLVAAGGLQPCDGEAILSSCGDRLPTRCVYQFNGQDGSDGTFPLEYVMRMLADWARDIPCDPFVKILNTGVSVLVQGYFNRPQDCRSTAITVDRNNIISKSTESAGISLSAIEKMKTMAGIDARPLQSCMWLVCFVRMPCVQLSFRFMGPEDPSRAARILRMSEMMEAKKQYSDATGRIPKPRTEPDLKKTPLEDLDPNSNEKNGLFHSLRNWKIISLLRGNTSFSMWAVLTLCILIVMFALVIWPFGGRI
uniref:Membrane protein n=1 Tax=anatid alphaherpesvirus 1 TaxID=104388 RepID=B3F8Y9_9ALPH|nr:membrane protein [Anatid alphaherpesvirus 1]